MPWFRSSVLYTWSFLALSLVPFVHAQEVRPEQVLTPSAVSTHSASRESISVAATGQIAGLNELPDSPGTQWQRQEVTAQQQSAMPSAQGPDAKPEGKPQRPVGTAAAEAPKVTGITAAEPAGVAIAPAKQKRVRTLVLKVGAIIGAGVALGTVVALSAGTSSKPPGAH